MAAGTDNVIRWVVYTVRVPPVLQYSRKLQIGATTANILLHEESVKPCPRAALAFHLA